MYNAMYYEDIEAEEYDFSVDYNDERIEDNDYYPADATEEEYNEMIQRIKEHESTVYENGNDDLPF